MIVGSYRQLTYPHIAHCALPAAHGTRGLLLQHRLHTPNLGSVPVSRSGVTWADFVSYVSALTSTRRIISACWEELWAPHASYPSFLCSVCVQWLLAKIAQHHWRLLPTVRENAWSLNPMGKPRSDSHVVLTRMETTPCPRISFPMVWLNSAREGQGSSCRTDL